MGSIRILMIDDDYEDVALVQAFLDGEQEYPTILEHCDTLHRGLERLKSSLCSIDLVLLDLGLTDSQGLNTFQQVYEAFPEMPVIVLSGNTDDTMSWQAMKAGAQDYLVKGQFKRDLLGRSIQYAIEQQDRRLELEKTDQAIQLVSEQLEKANRKLAELALIDGLTHLYNRRRFDELFSSEWQRLTRVRQPLSLIMGDVDTFKTYNDIYSHSVGDRCLQQIAHAILKVTKRPADIVGRYGRKEFVVALPNTELAGAIWIAEAIRTEISGLQMPYAASSVSHQVTMSLGVASLSPHEVNAPTQLLEMAGRALHLAKERGHNRIQTFQSDCDRQILPFSTLAEMDPSIASTLALC